MLFVKHHHHIQGIVYTLLGRELDSNGNIVNPLKVEWESGGVFVTPPGWWHSHHNKGNHTAWVLPMQVFWREILGEKRGAKGSLRASVPFFFFFETFMCLLSLLF